MLFGQAESAEWSQPKAEQWKVDFLENCVQGRAYSVLFKQSCVNCSSHSGRRFWENNGSICDNPTFYPYVIISIIKFNTWDYFLNIYVIMSHVMFYKLTVIVGALSCSDVSRNNYKSNCM